MHAFAALPAVTTANVRMVPRCAASPQSAPAPAVSRRALLSGVAAAAVALAVSPRSAEAAGKRLGTMTGDYKADAAKMLEDMKTATDLQRGAEAFVETVTRTRAEMNDFVALYRRNDKVSGSTSFNTMYTAINTLSGHYASYGNSYPVPEKRKKRLNQQYAEIDRALQRGR